LQPANVVPPVGSIPMTASDATRPLVVLHSVGRDFDVSKSWLSRAIERTPRQLLKAVDDVSFEIERGETLGLVGESGCGKSTVARLIVGLYLPSRGRIEFDGNPQTGDAGAWSADVRRRMQMIFQDPYASLNPRWRVGDIVAEPMRAQEAAPTPQHEQARVGELLTQVGLSPADARKYPHEFSGGQRQRISIARALSSAPEFLVCDEPTSALDVSVQAQILNLMKTLQEHLGLTYLFISHNLAVVSQMATRVGVMYLGRIVELATSSELFTRPQHPYTRMLLDAIPDLEMSGRPRTSVAGEVANPLEPPAGCAFHPRCPHANERCRVERPVLHQWRRATRVACHAVAEGRIA
jgi:peptide/nickel transport system ATP-binding protein